MEWEYDTKLIDPSDPELVREKLDGMGSEKWELAAVVPAHTEVPEFGELLEKRTYLAIFKRPRE